MKVQYRKHGVLQFYQSECLFTITDVPESILPLLAMAGICPGKLDELIMDEKEVWHG